MTHIKYHTWIAVSFTELLKNPLWLVIVIYNVDKGNETLWDVVGGEDGVEVGG